MTVEEPLSDDEDGVPHSVSDSESESESEKDSEMKKKKINRFRGF